MQAEFVKNAEYRIILSPSSGAENLAVVAGKVQISKASYTWDIQLVSESTEASAALYTIQDSNTKKYLNDNGSYYELIGADNGSNNRWYGLRPNKVPSTITNNGTFRNLAIPYNHASDQWALFEQ
ncbi:hypothetical protein A1O7_06213 [Cladophialophora yegresii CBS 114405]|uniref:Uncharacterized protein n=1 Tax=Cladophialophora yegresii CBS 114405 TaxID=1182544 RepID=W9VT83_9EURO|nr:uncharacterized protein A1O7_06213 [Cladophialophora yegresii CBS 114405]EXJ58783.1 hypothetical protein A1O7_06213 [Cladophialophora yegresii CBS 114405]